MTGATGCLGHPLVRYLLSQGLQVTALGREAIKGEALQAIGAEFHAIDLWDLTALKAAFTSVDTVVHCGGLTTMWDRRSQFYRVNTLGTRNVVAACLHARVQRLIHMSSASIYINGQDRLNIRETDALPRRFINTYAWSKYLADQHVQYGMAQGLPAIILRPMGLIGGDETPLLTGLIKANAHTGLPYCRQGQSLTDMTCVDNATHAIWLALTAPDSACGQAYHISNQSPETVSQIVNQLFEALEQPVRWRPLSPASAWNQTVIQDWLSRLTGIQPNLTRYHVAWLSHSHTLDVSKASQCLGYTPQIRLEQGIEAFARFWRNLS